MNRVDLGRLGESLRAALGEVVIQGPDVRVTGVSGDSRAVRDGDLFVATEGSREDGLAYVDQALAHGAVAVLASRRPDLPADVGFLGVADVARAKARVADDFFGHPSGRLRVVGVTGTNGKTTTAFMLRSMLTMDGQGSGLVGTLGAWIGSHYEPLDNTTPDAIELQRLLARMVDANLTAAVIEVSSHALVQHRVDGVDVDVAIFTNLSRDHLDYHGTMADYARAKARLFQQLTADATAVLNADDPWAQALADSTAARVVTYGIDQPADVTGEIQRLDPDGTTFRLRAPELGLDMPVTSRLVGRHNVSNALAACAGALAMGLPPSAARTGLSSLSAVPGRLQPVECGQDFRVLVDYAHTPDALEKVLELLRPLSRGRLRVVFGCGGDRDRTKRPLMGEVAARLADDLYVTSDNPRSEEPSAILDEILGGVPGDARERLCAVVDRREAISRACRDARGGDIVLVAGKGHETTQTVGERILPFDDREVAREILWSL